MNRQIYTIGALLLLFTLGGCTKGTESELAAPITQRDKMLNCKGLEMEISDAKFIIFQAKKNRGFRAGNILWPFGYGATFISASEAINSAEARIAYLQRVYEIKGCHERPRSFLPE